MNDHEARPRGAEPLQFELRTVFIAIAGLSGWFAIGVWLGACGLVLVPVVVWFITWLAWMDAEQRRPTLILVSILGCGLAVGVFTVAPDPVRSGRRPQCSSNLKQMGLALHTYYVTYQCFPPAYVADDSGKPMHSWRVLLLPYMERGDLYRRYHFDEPWDGPEQPAAG